MSFRTLAAHWLVALGVLISANATAQAPAGDVLTGKELTRDSLLDALEPMRSRSLRIGAATAAVPQRASASLLITFSTDSAELTADAKRQLDIMASALKTDRLASYRFIVEGHADPRGDPGRNFALSQARAESVKRYLIAQHSVEDGRLQATGKGDQQPLNPRVPAAPENRRVTFITQQ